MTRQSESWLRDSIKNNLQYLVFDELHTYRGRQGSDVSMLVRRIKSWCNNDLSCIGTSATMASAGNPDEKKEAVAKVATTIFGTKYGIDQIIREYLDTCTSGKQFNAIELRNALIKGIDETADEREFINTMHIFIRKTHTNINDYGRFERLNNHHISTYFTQAAQWSNSDFFITI